MTLPPWPRAILHLDMDAFFVNVHLLEHPADGGRPLAVGGRPNQRGVISSASYEARQAGVRSAMPASRALRLCPQLKIVPANWDRIRASSRQIMDVLSHFGPLEPISVDEAYLDLSASADAPAEAHRVKAAVIAASKLPCSVGLATSKLVAKVASDHDKPDGLTVVPPGSEARFLAPKPVRALWGIGPRTAAALQEINVHTCSDLAQADVGLLRNRFGQQAASLIDRARGIDARPVQTDRGPAKSISQEWTFATDVNDPLVLGQHLAKMSTAVARSLRAKGLLAHTVIVKFRWADFTTFTRQKSLQVGTDDPGEILTLAAAIFEENWPAGQHMRLLGVGVSNLDEGRVRQLRFRFGDEADESLG